MFGFFEPREMHRSFAARGIYCSKLVLNGFTHPGGKITFEISRKRLMSSRGMFRYDSITVSCARELASVSMRYSQGSLGLCTVRTISIGLCVRWSFRSVPVSCVQLSSVARSCATRDSNNKDNAWEPTLPAGINRPPPSETISHVTRVPDH